MNYLLKILIPLTILVGCGKVEEEKDYKVKFESDEVHAPVGEATTLNVLFANDYKNSGKLVFSTDNSDEIEILETGDDYVTFITKARSIFDLRVTLVSHGSINSTAEIKVIPKSKPVTDAIIYLANSSGGTSSYSNIYEINPENSSFQNITNSYSSKSTPSITPDGKFLLYRESNRLHRLNLVTMDSEVVYYSSVSRVDYSTKGDLYTFSISNYYSSRVEAYRSSTDSEITTYSFLTNAEQCVLYSQDYPVNAVYTSETYYDGYFLYLEKDNQRITVDQATSGEIHDPKFSRDGNFIVYEKTSSSTRSNIWLYDISAATKRQLTNNTGRNTHPGFSPDGTKVVYSSNKNSYDNYDLFIISLTDNSEKQLTNTEETNEIDPIWN